MLTEKLEMLFSKRNVLEHLKRYKDTPDYGWIKKSIQNGDFLQMLQKGYIPDPMRSMQIPKSNGEMRQIAMASTASKLIQRVLAEALSQAVKLSDKSYAFRKGKGTHRAINRTKDFLYLKGYTHVAKADIDDFFDTIDQEKLIAVLEKAIVDKRIVVLISTFLKNGMMHKQRWIDKSEGVYQGDVLSPVLSNIYLHTFDTALENKGIDFVRFADDMVFFAKSQKEAQEHMAYATKVLNALSLRFGEEKCYLASLEEGFEFLGLRFKGREVLMDNDRLMKKLSTLSKKSKKLDLPASIDFFNEAIAGLKRYYLKVLDNMSQLSLIEEHIDTILVHKIAKAKQEKSINNKSRFIQLLTALDDLGSASEKERKAHAKALVARAYESIALNDPLKTAEKMVAKKKADVLQEQLKSSELVLNKYGLYVSLSKGKVVVKEYGKVVKKMPLNWLTRIIVMTRGASLSTSLIFECAKRKVDIDFIDKQKPYAQITYFSNISNELHLKQLELKNSDEGLHIARAIIKAKMKNQINLVKYHARYREESDPEEFSKLDACIGQMEKIFAKIKKAKNISMLMGYEGSCSVVYWKAFGIIIGDETFTRETKDAPDAVNQALNYGYAFLYQRVQAALLKVGVNIYHSFLHVPQANKPTLVFDMIEPFRQPVVDREVISILNLGTKITSNKGRLSKKSVRVITENVQERLATPTRWRKGKFKIMTIIDEQALEMAHVIKGVKSTFKGFVVRY